MENSAEKKQENSEVIKYTIENNESKSPGFNFISSDPESSVVIIFPMSITQKQVIKWIEKIYINRVKLITNLWRMEKDRKKSFKLLNEIWKEEERVKANGE
jgi:hypothetical protein